MADLKLPNHVAQAILDYLIERPYKEVFKLVAELMALPPIELPLDKVAQV